MFSPRRRHLAPAACAAVLVAALSFATAPGSSVEPPDDPSNPFCTLLHILCPE